MTSAPIALHCHGESLQPWLDAFGAAFPDLNIQPWEQIAEPLQVRYAVVWQPPTELFARFPNLEVIFNLGAGVDAILKHPQLPDTVQVARLEDAGMGSQMNEYCAYHSLYYYRQMDRYQAQQQQQQWQPYPMRTPASYQIGVLGLGVLGAQVAQCLRGFGFNVRGWSNRPKAIDGVDSFAGAEQLGAFLHGTQLLICLLPLSANTEGLIDAALLDQLAPGACLINAARGEIINEPDLIASLDKGQLRGATLDAFAVEPLPQQDPLWHHPRINITPHVAAQSWLEPTVAQVGANINRGLAGQALTGVVDRSSGY